MLALTFWAIPVLGDFGIAVPCRPRDRHEAFDLQGSNAIDFRTTIRTRSITVDRKRNSWRWLLVDMLATARRTAAAADLQALRTWMDTKVRRGGLCENAALVAVLDTPLRSEALAAYDRAHPDRRAIVSSLLRWT
jgi:hypothetical protein